MATLHLNLDERGYDISIGRGILGLANRYFNLERRVFIITDDGVPSEYSDTVKKLCKEAMVFTVGQGEGSKSIAIYEKVLSEMLEFGMTRADCVVAVGGGVVGDLAGFVSASYMRGIDFYNIPTTLLSQVDSSIGGKTALNLGGVKNIVGAFYHPKGVLIDVDTLKTLPERQFKNGLCEVVKMAATCDKELFQFIENSDFGREDIEKIIVGALKIKKSVVEADERETGLRRVLNFGHTLGHAIEVNSDYYHGECVGIGMLPFSTSEARDRIENLLKKVGLPTEYKGVNSLSEHMKMDKKAEGDGIFCVFVDKIGSFEIKKITFDELEKIIEEGYKK